MERYVMQRDDIANKDVIGNLVIKAKSDSGCHGAELRYVHFEIGHILGNTLIKKYKPEDTAIVILLTGAIPFGLGIADVLDTKVYMYDPHSNNNLPVIKEKNVVIADEVINSGKSIISVANKYKDNHEVILATTVMPENSEAFQSEYSIYTCRVSSHRYVGAKTTEIKHGKGPDTAARLYSLI